MLRSRVSLLKSVGKSFTNQKFTVNVARSFSTNVDKAEAPTSSRKANNPIKNYLELSKANLSAMVVFTSGAGFVCSGILPFDLATMAAVCGGTSLCAASASTFNQIVEIKRDASMKRTFNRPLPSGKISKSAAINWGVGTGVAGTALLLAGCNPVVAALGAFNIVLYGGAYTYSKQFTELNTWIGAVVGAIPPMMGWAAATGGDLLSAEPIALAALLFLWQFPHFFAIAWMYREDYARGGFQMVPCNDPDGSRTATLIRNYSLYLTALPILTSVSGLTSYMFCVEGCLLNGYLLMQARKFEEERTNSNARKIFMTSLIYLPALLFFYLYHSRMWNKETLDNESPEFLLQFREMKDYMKRLCLHEVLVNSEDVDGSGLCPKVVGEEVLDSGVETIEGVKEVAEVLLNETQQQGLIINNISRHNDTSSSSS